MSARSISRDPELQRNRTGDAVEAIVELMTMPANR
jgi:hypothetical protein